VWLVSHNWLGSQGGQLILILAKIWENSYTKIGKACIPPIRATKQ